MSMNKMDSTEFFEKLGQAIMAMDLRSFGDLVSLLPDYGKTEVRVFIKIISRPGELLDRAQGVYYSEAAVNALKGKPEIFVITLQEETGIPTANLPLSTRSSQN